MIFFHFLRIAQINNVLNVGSERIVQFRGDFSGVYLLSVRQATPIPYDGRVPLQSVSPHGLALHVPRFVSVPSHSGLPIKYATLELYGQGLMANAIVLLVKTVSSKTVNYEISKQHPLHGPPWRSRATQRNATRACHKSLRCEFKFSSVCFLKWDFPRKPPSFFPR